MDMEKLRAQIFKDLLKEKQAAMTTEQWPHQKVLIVSHRAFGKVLGTKNLSNCEITHIDHLFN